MILDWLENEFGRVVVAPEDWRVNCPFCPTYDTKQHLYISQHKPIAHCFRCGWSGSHFALVKEVAGAESYAEVRRLFHRPASVAEYNPIIDRLTPRRAIASEDIVQLPGWYKPLTEEQNSEHYRLVLDYALKRLDWSEITKFGIGYCSDVSMPLRMIIPIEKGFYQARSIYNSSRKYLNPNFPVGSRLFNYEALSKYSHVYICEGAISAIAVGSNAIATLGKEINKEQLQRLSKSKVKKFTIAFDAGEETKSTVLRAADWLMNRGKQVGIRKYDEGDPDDGGDYSESKYSFSYKISSLLFA